MKKDRNQPLIPLPILLGVLLITPLIALLSTTPKIGKSNSKLYPSPPKSVQQKDNPYTRLLNTLENRPGLNQKDQQAKEQILSFWSPENYPGNIYNTDLYSIDYLKSADYFQVEIRTSNINQAKSEAYNWFIRQGMSQQGICNLPVQFYLNSEVKSYLQRPSIDINPLPEGC